MVSICKAAGVNGIDGYPVTVECFFSSGLPRLDIVGLPDKAVSESAERVRAAAKSCGFDWPVSRLTVNLAPANTRKEGSIYDLPILLSILAVSGQIDPLPQNAAFLGELSLSGEIRPIVGALSMAMAAGDAGLDTVYLPADNAEEAAYAEGVTVYPVADVGTLLDHLAGRKSLSPCPPPAPAEDYEDKLDFRHVLGQQAVKRALEIAASGGHNLLLSGSPGSGKSMMAKRFPTILPPLSREERLEVIRIWSLVGLGAEAARMAGRPFRAPHHTTSSASMSGGGSARVPKPGEISLAHGGVLFLDELPEFHTDVLETLRQPIEDGVVSISRVNGKVSYPARFQLIAAMNPCRCGWYGTDRCTCTPNAVHKYLHRLSGPLLDRIDLQVQVQPVKYEALAARGRSEEECSADIRARVIAARERQSKRFCGTDIRCNAQIPPERMAQDCPLTDKAEALLQAAFSRLGLTARAYDRIIRTARTIADLAGQELIDDAAISEALQYRSLDRQLR